MKITGIEINNEFLPYFEKDISSGYFRSFMNYCIDNYFDRIIINIELRKWFSLVANDPMFKSAYDKDCIQEHHDLYYSMNNSTAEKIGIMYHLANVIGIGLYVYTM